MSFLRSLPFLPWQTPKFSKEDQSQLDTYNQQIEAYSKAVDDYNAAVEKWNAGPRTTDFDYKAPADLPFTQETLDTFSEAATKRAKDTAAQRELALAVMANPQQYNLAGFGFADGGEASVQEFIAAQEPRGMTEEQAKSELRRFMDVMAPKVMENMPVMAMSFVPKVVQQMGEEAIKRYEKVSTTLRDLSKREEKARMTVKDFYADKATRDAAKAELAEIQAQQPALRQELLEAMGVPPVKRAEGSPEQGEMPIQNQADMVLGGDDVDSWARMLMGALEGDRTANAVDMKFLEPSKEPKSDARKMMEQMGDMEFQMAIAPRTDYKNVPNPEDFRFAYAPPDEQGNIPPIHQLHGFYVPPKNPGGVRYLEGYDDTAYRLPYETDKIYLINPEHWNESVQQHETGHMRKDSVLYGPGTSSDHDTEEFQQRASQFLTETSGKYWPKTVELLTTYDPVVGKRRADAAREATGEEREKMALEMMAKFVDEMEPLALRPDRYWVRRYKAVFGEDPLPKKK